MHAANSERRWDWRRGLDSVAALAMLCAAATMLLDRWRPASSGDTRRPREIAITTEPLSLDGFPLKGDRGAAVGVIVYSDFECPFSRRFARDVLPALERELVEPGTLLLAFGHLPIQSIHPSALAAAALAACAHRRGHFWRVHDHLFGLASLSRPSIDSLPRELGFEEDSACLNAEGKVLVREHQRLAEEIGITGTPSFLVGSMQSGRHLRVRRALSGLQSVEAIVAAVRAVGTGQ
jgi:protein-disulfide isomerase